MTPRLAIVTAALMMALAVALGAFGAHALKGNVGTELLNTFEAGARYQMYHAFALCAAAWGWARWQDRLFGVAGGLFVAGIVLFSGSLYVLSLTGIHWLGAVTPIGGTAFLAAWAMVALAAYRAQG